MRTLLLRALDSLPLGIAIWDRNHELVYTSRPLQELLDEEGDIGTDEVAMSLGIEPSEVDSPQVAPMELATEGSARRIIVHVAPIIDEKGTRHGTSATVLSSQLDAEAIDTLQLAIGLLGSGGSDVDGTPRMHPAGVPVPPGVAERLSHRQLEIARMLASGLSTRTIGGILGISPHTVRNHIKQVFAKLGVHSQLELVALLSMRNKRIVPGRIAL